MAIENWMSKYKQTVEDIFGSEEAGLSTETDVPNEALKEGLDPVWSALINIQENINSFSFDDWMKYVDYVLKIIIDKNSSEIEDLPYYDLWNNNMNPLVVSMYAIFESSERLDDTPLPEGADDIWYSSKYNQEMKSKIDYIMAHY